MTTRERFEQLVFQAVINYRSYMNEERKIDNSDVTLHKVGHSTTHEFWLGLMPDGERLVYVSICKDRSPVEAVGDEFIKVYSKDEYPSYIGHW
jgi:hypothetical protein